MRAAVAASQEQLLSIGDVLGLLKSDFPDVTISKIRFLEAEGLVTPQRTASGYRKFAPADVQRLRYILGMQRDQYLPLRVIKDGLSADDRVVINGMARIFRPGMPVTPQEEGATPAPGANPQSWLRLARPEQLQLLAVAHDPRAQARGEHGIVHPDSPHEGCPGGWA